MKAVILAAGVGSRMLPLTSNTPKSLLLVGGKTILERMLIAISQAGITEVGIVTGYYADKIETFVREKFPQLTVVFIHNTYYKETNTGYSLLLVKEFVDESNFIKFDADVVFDPKILEKLIKSPYSSALCIDKNIHLEAEEVKVIVGRDNKVIKVGKKLDVKQATGESIGIEKIDNVAGKILFAELKDLMRDKKNWQEYYDDTYTTLVEKGCPMYAVDITGLKWVEIDKHEDFAKVEKLFV